MDMEIINFTVGNKDVPKTKHKSFNRRNTVRRNLSVKSATITDSLLFPQFTVSSAQVNIKKSRKLPFITPRLSLQKLVLATASKLFDPPTRLKTHKSYFDGAVKAKTVLWTMLILISIFMVQLFYRIFLNSSEFLAPSQPSLISLPVVPTTDGAILNHKMQNFATIEAKPFDDSGFLSGSNKTPLVSTKPVSFTTYKVKSGDTIAGITKNMGLNNISTLIAINDIDNCSALCAGQKLRIPSIDGIFYTVNQGESLEGISAKFAVPLEELIDVNELESSDLSLNQRIFVPGATLDKATLEAAIGTFFKSPLAHYRISSYFGKRLDPITGVKSSHTGIDMAAAMGTPICASCSGVVSTAGFSNIFGNYVIIKHSNNYQTLYGHMSKSLAKKGQWVSQGTRIGLVGSTGYSTGPHLHFTVYKNGRLVDPLTLIK